MCALDAMTVAPLPSASSHLRVPFLFVPDGTENPPERARFKVEHPGWVKFRATFRPRPGSSPLVTTIPPMPVVEAQTRLQETVRGPWPPPTGARLHGTRLAAPRIVEPWQPPPRLPSSQSPLPAAYTGPQSLTGAFVGTAAASTGGRAALIRTAQAMLDSLANPISRTIRRGKYQKIAPGNDPSFDYPFLRSKKPYIDDSPGI